MAMGAPVDWTGLSVMLVEPQPRTLGAGCTAHTLRCRWLPARWTRVGLLACPALANVLELRAWLTSGVQARSHGPGSPEVDPPLGWAAHRTHLHDQNPNKLLDVLVCADVDGDMLPDGVLITDDLDAEGLPMNVSVARGLGDGWGPPQVWFKSQFNTSTYSPDSSNPVSTTYLLADINDDSKADLILVLGQSIYALYSSGTGFAPQYVPVAASNLSSTNGRRSLKANANADSASVAGLPGGLTAFRRKLLKVLDARLSMPAAASAPGMLAALADTAGTHTPVEHGGQDNALAWPMSVRQRAAGRWLQDRAQLNAVTSGWPQLFEARADAATAHAPDGASRRLQQLSGNPVPGMNIALLGTMAANVTDTIALCSWHSYGVSLLAEVPGDQLLLACPSE